MRARARIAVCAWVAKAKIQNKCEGSGISGTSFLRCGPPRVERLPRPRHARDEHVAGLGFGRVDVSEIELPISSQI